MKAKNNLYMTIDFLGNIYIKDTIIYYDKPLVFSCINDFGQWFIASCNIIEEIEEWIFLPLTYARLIQGLQGNVSAYNLFKNPEGRFLWKVKINSHNYSEGKAQQIDPHSLTDDDLPDKDIVYDIYKNNNFSINNKDVEKILETSLSERREILDISLEPSCSHEHEISCEVLGDLLVDIQKIIYSIADKESLGGRVTEKTKEENSLNIVGTFAASFGVRLKSKDMSDILNYSKIQNNIKLFMELLESKFDAQRVKNILLDLNPSVSIRYSSFLRKLYKNNLSIKASCAFPDSYTKKSNLNYSEIDKCIRMLDNDIKTNTRDIEEEGLLVGVNISKRKFEFVNIKGDVIRGDIDKTVKVKEYILPRHVKIKVNERIEYNNIINKEQVFYTLLELTYKQK